MEGPIAIGVTILLVITVIIAAIALQLRSLLETADAHTALVAVGARPEGGERQGYRVVVGPGRLWRIPLIERVERLDLRPMALGFTVDPVSTADGLGVCLRVEARAWISHREHLLFAAIQNFLGASQDRIARVAIEAAQEPVRRTLAEIAARDLAVDLETVEAELAGAVGRALEALGLELGALTVVSATDRSGVLHGIRGGL